MSQARTLPHSTDAPRPTAEGYPAHNLRFDLIVTVLSGLLLFGAYLDGWAHNNLSESLESFFTPWHAVLYSALGAVALFIFGTHLLNARRGYRWGHTLPRGYYLTLLGVGVMSVAGAGDFLWHSIFGIEFGFDASVSPTHLIAAFGITMIMGGGLLAGWLRRAAPTRWIEWLPVLLSAAFTLSSITVISQTLHPITRPVADFALQPAAGMEEIATYGWAFGSLALQTFLLSAIALLVVFRWGRQLPFGTFTLILTVNALLLAFEVYQWRFVPAWLVGGLIADALIRALPIDRPNGGRLFAILMPVGLYAVYFVVILLTGGTWWRVHSITGALTWIAVIGGLCGLLVWKPALDFTPGD